MKQTQVINPFQPNNDRIGIKILSEYCRILSEKRYYNLQYETKKFSETLILFAEVCPVIYDKGVERQLKNLAAYFRKRLLQQQIFVVKSFMKELRQTAVIVDDKFFQQLSYELENREWNNDMTEQENQTILLRLEAKKQYERVLPLYTKELNRMYPNVTCPIDDDTLYRVLDIYGSHAGGETPERPFQGKLTGKNADKKAIEKGFEMRSKYMKVKNRPQKQHQRNDHSHCMSVPTRRKYSRELTKEALQQHHHMQQANMRARHNYEEFWHQYSQQVRCSTFPGRRAVSGGFEVEASGGPSRPTRAHSDDGGRVYTRHQASHLGNSFDIGMQYESPEFDAFHDPHMHLPNQVHHNSHDPRNHNAHDPRNHIAHDPRNSHNMHGSHNMHQHNSHNQHQHNPHNPHGAPNHNMHGHHQHPPQPNHLHTQLQGPQFLMCTPSPTRSLTLNANGSMDPNTEYSAEWRNAFRL